MNLKSTWHAYCLGAEYCVLSALCRESNSKLLYNNKSAIIQEPDKEANTGEAEAASLHPCIPVNMESPLPFDKPNYGISQQLSIEWN